MSDKDTRFMWEGDFRMAALRPDKPEICLQIANECLAMQNTKRLDNLPQEAQSRGVQYTFAGWLAVDGKSILDGDGRVIDTPQPGDSFVTLPKEPG